MGDVVVAHIYRMPDVDFAGRVHECNVMVARDGGGRRVRHGRVLGGPLPRLRRGVAHGREVHGQPKNLAKLVLETRGDLIVGEVERNGITILTATTTFKQQRAAPAEMRRHFDFAENINYKVIPHIDGTPAIRQLTPRRLAGSRCQRVLGRTVHGRAAAERSGPALPAAVLEPLEGYFWRANFTLVADACSTTTWRRPSDATRPAASWSRPASSPTSRSRRRPSRGRPVDLRLSVLDTPEQVARETAAADAVVVTIEPLPRASIEQLGPGVRIIARAGIGLDAIDLVAAKERGIAVFHTP